MAGISVQAIAALRSGSAGAWTVPPGGLRFYQLALPFEDGARKGVVLMSSVSATTSNHFVFVDSLGPATWVRLADGTVIATKDLFEKESAERGNENRGHATSG